MSIRDPATGNVIGPFTCWGCSNLSIEDAEANGREKAERIARMVNEGRQPDRYLYGDQPLREEVMDEWKDSANQTHAAVTRNSYGCEVLNTTRVMFVDVDFREPEFSDRLFHMLLVSLRRRQSTLRSHREVEAVKKVRQLIQHEPGCGVRIYRTRGGLRYLFTHNLREPEQDETIKTMTELGSDPLYVTLCRTQKCFRARLTPKPWRCGWNALGIRYPWNKQTESRVRAWKEGYVRKALPFATCSFVAHLGSDRIHPEITRVVRFHDEKAKSHSGLKLA